ncbi:MAG: peptide deformylase [Clostridia bacterium]
MAIRKIFTEEDKLLLRRSRPIDRFDDRLAELLDDMHETMVKNDGVGLAGPQVGILRRVAVVEADDEYYELINAKITDASGEQIDTEACLSVDSSKNCKVLRPDKVTFSSYDRNGKKYTATVEGLLARAVCHELDHLEGILFYTREYKGK